MTFRKSIPVMVWTLLISSFAMATSLQDFNGDTTKNKERDWHHEDPASGKIIGIGTEKAYQALKNKKARKVVVAIIDSGVDIEHEDLKGNIWKNENEIPGNGIDDDKNGYVDDVYGWNFLGNSKGENVDWENLEVTRLYKKYYLKFKDKTPAQINASDKQEYLFYQEVKKSYEKEYEDAKMQLGKLNDYLNQVTKHDSTIRSYLQKETYSVEDLNVIKEEHLSEAVKSLSSMLKRGGSIDKLKDRKEMAENTFKYYLNLEYDARKFIGDDSDNLKDSLYGNNDVIGKSADHGTHVAGIVAALRNNGKGMNGVADNALIMTLRVVPNGDEQDKDVANAIRYAVNNGANIINMSFGKKYSPHKNEVYKAMKYAESKGVLLVHAAGNNAENIDEIIHYPANYIEGAALTNYVCVGASSKGNDHTLIGNFSNHGKKYVDIFAPGVKIYSTTPNNEYAAFNGTSMACPVVAGVAALVWSYYPQLSANELREILIKSGSNFKKMKVNKPGAFNEKGDPLQVKFGKLSTSGKIVNAYEAVKLAEMKSKK